MSLPREKPDLQKKLHDVPHSPGIYVMRDRLNRVIYVGKARDLRKRLSNYFVPSRHNRADLKTKALIESIWEFEFQTVRNEPEALLLEGRLIKEFRPRYNISFRDDKRFLLVKVHMGDPYPRFTLTRLKKEDGARYFGPFAHSGALRTTLNWMNKRFGLRVCRPQVPGENDYRHCNNDVIKNCAAPCIGRVSSEEYKARVEEAASFLEGKSRDLVGALQEEMQKAAQRLDFEKAAELRDMIEDLKKTLRPTRTFERGARARVVGQNLDPDADVKELQEYLHLERPPLVMECFDIANIGTTHCVASMVRFTNGRSDNANYRRYRIRIVSGQNDFLAMSEVVRRRYSRILLEGRERMGDDADFSQENPLEAMRRLEEQDLEQEEDEIGLETEPVETSPETDADADADADQENELSGEETDEALTEDEAEEPEESAAEAPKRPRRPKKKSAFVRLPDLVIIDGGKGQLGVAMAELQRLGLQDLPVIGLAKEEEEIYRPGLSDPIRIPHDRGALKLLQRIRDEAHRWANGYHQLLLRRRVEESILDDCPGVSENRKANLLRSFGSVARLRRATPEQIAEVPGIGKGLATEISRFLQERSGK